MPPPLASSGEAPARSQTIDSESRQTRSSATAKRDFLPMTFKNFARRAAPVALVAASALVLVGCASGDNADSGNDSTDAAAGCTEYTPGSASDGVKVSGDFGKDVTAKFDTPVGAKDLERTIVDKGDGDLTAVGDDVNAQITIFNGSTGESTFSEPGTIALGDPSYIPAFVAGIECVPVGSRVVTVVPAASIFEGAGNEQFGIAAGDDVVVVTDVIDKVVAATPADWTTDPAEVTFNGDAAPVLTLPQTGPPAELLLKVLEPGDGAVVAAGDNVTLNYQGTSWNTGEIFDQSYGKEPATFPTTGVIEGFGAALVDQKVGTKLVVSIPPKYAYGEEGAGAELSGQTLVFVIEILDAAPAK